VATSKADATDEVGGGWENPALTAPFPSLLYGAAAAWANYTKKAVLLSTSERKRKKAK
jgi:hypothetical protein